MSTHALRDQVAPGVWTPRLIVGAGVYVSSTGKQDYLVYRTLTAADGLEAGALACFCIGFRIKQLRGEPADCRHVRAHREREAPIRSQEDAEALFDRVVRAGEREDPTWSR